MNTNKITYIAYAMKDGVIGTYKEFDNLEDANALAKDSFLQSLSFLNDYDSQYFKFHADPDAEVDYDFVEEDNDDSDMSIEELHNLNRDLLKLAPKMMDTVDFGYGDMFRVFFTRVNYCTYFNRNRFICNEFRVEVKTDSLMAKIEDDFADDLSADNSSCKLDSNDPNRVLLTCDYDDAI